MSLFKPFPEITLYRQTIRSVTDKVRYRGRDENDKPIYDGTAVLPVIEFEGTVKLHGTNAGIIKNGEEIYCQSRKEVLDYPKRDNYGFALFVHKRKEILKEIFATISQKQECAIYGEWCGGNIQKGVGLTELEKMFVIFGVKIYEPEPEWVNVEQQLIKKFNEHGIYHIKQFPYFKMTIDFNRPKDYQNELVELTQQVEQQCPVSKFFGIDGIGEGIVWKGITEGWTSSRYWFKVKGDKHSSSKIKKLAPVDTEKIKNAQKFAEYAVTESRLNQALEHVELDIKKTGEFIKWILNDIMKEEADTMADNDLSKQNIGGSISKIARDWFFKKIQEQK